MASSDPHGSPSPDQHERVEPHFEDFARRDWEQPTDAGPLRFAVVGLGGFARNRALPAIRECDYCEPGLLVSGSPDKAIETAEEFDVDRVVDYEAFHDGEAADAFDAVYVAVPTALHAEYVERAASLGKDVLCEKPLAATVDGGRRMVEACRDAGVTLMTAYRLHAEPAVRRAREIISGGCMGRPVQIHSSFSTRLLDDFDPDHWRLDPEIAGGGAMMDIGVYPLNTARFLLDADPDTVQAETTSWEGPFADVDEHVAFQLRFPGGETASCTASFNAKPNSVLEIVGTTGRIRIESPYGGDVPQEIVAECGDVRTEYTGPPIDDVHEEFAYFANHVLTDRRPGPDGEDGLCDLKVADAVYESADGDGRVDVSFASPDRSG